MTEPYVPPKPMTPEEIATDRKRLHDLRTSPHTLQAYEAHIQTANERWTRALDEVDRLNTLLFRIVRDAQRHQPPGSPIPGSAAELVRWILETVVKDRLDLLTDMSHFVGVVDQLQSDLGKQSRSCYAIDGHRIERLRARIAEVRKRVPK